MKLSSLKSAINRSFALSLTATLLACSGGGGSGLSPGGFFTNGMSSGVDSTGVPDFELNEQSYVAFAAALYSGSTGLAAVINLQVGGMLLLASTAQEPTSARPCDGGGETVFDVVKPTYEAFTLVSTGDSVSQTNNDCVNSSGSLRQGSNSLLVRLQAMDGTPGVSQYEISGDMMTTRANGEVSLARSHLEIVHSTISSPRGDISFMGINNTVLQDTRAPDENSLLSGVAPESLAVFQGSTVDFYETSTGRFDTFAAETAILDIEGYSRVERQFEFDLNETNGSGSSYTIATTQPFITMEVDGLPDPEDPGAEPDTALVALGGGFVINMDTGQRIEVSIIGSSSPDAIVGPLDANVRVSFDRESDGNVDAEQTLSFSDFNASLFGLLFAR